MSKSLILDWQKNAVMLAKAQGRAGKVSIEGVSIKTIGAADDVSQSATGAIRAAAGELHAKGEVVALIARELVELRTVQVPKIDPDDLPDVIRFQAQRQFANMTDAWVVDYVLLPPTTTSEMQTALVAAISPTTLAEIESACTSNGLQPGRITLRPLQIAAFATDSGLVPTTGRAMVVCVSESIADLLILRDGKVVQVRSTKLPSEPDQVASALQGEVRRSLLAASAELDGQPVEMALLVAAESRTSSLLESIQQATGTSAKAFSSESLLENSDHQLADIAACRLFAAAGAASATTIDRAKSIDFKNPKKRPPKKRDSRKWLLIGGAAAALLISAIGWYYTTVNRLDAEYAMIQEELEAKKDSGENAKRRLAEFESIEQFTAGAPNWLDELVYISEQIPPSNKIMLESPSFSIGRNNQGIINLGIKSADTGSIPEFGEALRKNEHYSVSTKGTQTLPRPEGLYRFRSEATVTITGKGWDLAASNNSEAAPPAETTTTAPATEALQPAEPAVAKAANESAAEPAPNTETAPTAAAMATPASNAPAEPLATEPTEQTAEPASAKPASADAQPVQTAAPEPQTDVAPVVPSEAPAPANEQPEPTSGT